VFATRRDEQCGKEKDHKAFWRLMRISVLKWPEAENRLS
jgi:hypothetical protein